MPSHSINTLIKVFTNLVTSRAILDFIIFFGNFITIYLN